MFERLRISFSMIIGAALLSVVTAGPCFSDDVNCYPTAETYATGCTDFGGLTDDEVFVYGGLTSGATRRPEGFFKFSIAHIPTLTTVTLIEFHFYVNDTYYPYWTITPVTHDPVITDALTMWNDINAEATSGYYNLQNEASYYAAGWKKLALGGNAIADLNAILGTGQEWFALGAVCRDSSPAYYLDIDGRTSVNRPFLVVRDNPPVENNTCESATVIMPSPGVSSYSQDSGFAENSYNCMADCVNQLDHSGADVAYRVTVPADSEICVTVNQSEIDWNVGVYLVSDCDDVNGSCLAGSSEWVPPGGYDESFCYTNPASEAETYFILVDGRSGSFGEFRMDVTVSGVVSPTDLSCMASDSVIELQWQNNDQYETIGIMVNGQTVDSISGLSSSYTFTPVTTGFHCFEICGSVGVATQCSEPCGLIWGYDDLEILWDFEADDGGFTVSGTGSWQWGTPAWGPCATAADGRVWATDLSGDYLDDICWILESPEVALDSGGAFLSIDHCYSIEDVFDGANVWFSTNGGHHTLREPLDGYDGRLSGSISQCPWISNQRVFFGYSGGWVEDIWDLSGPEWAGENVRLTLVLGSDNSIHEAGWMISSITLYRPQEPGTVSCSLSCTPASGLVPFITRMTISATNNFSGSSRIISGDVVVTLANGRTYPHWKHGFTTIGPGEAFNTSWDQQIPALSSLIGENIFRLVAVDVTPPPYNLPPYPPSGDTDSDVFTVTASPR